MLNFHCSKIFWESFGGDIHPVGCAVGDTLVGLWLIRCRRYVDCVLAVWRSLCPVRAVHSRLCTRDEGPKPRTSRRRHRRSATAHTTTVRTIHAFSLDILHIGSGILWCWKIPVGRFSFSGLATTWNSDSNNVLLGSYWRNVLLSTAGHRNRQVYLRLFFRQCYESLFRLHKEFSGHTLYTCILYAQMGPHTGKHMANKRPNNFK